MAVMTEVAADGARRAAAATAARDLTAAAARELGTQGAPEPAAGGAPAGTGGGGAASGAPDVAGEIVRAMVDAYRRRGYHQIAFPASALLAFTGSLERLEQALAALLDVRHLVPAGMSQVSLHPSARTALLSQSVLARWLDAFSLESPQRIAMYRDRVTAELATLVSWAAGATAVPDDLTQRAAALAGTLATRELDPQAFELVNAHGGTPRGRLTALATVPPRSLDLNGLRLHLRHAVSSHYLG
jgi:hypothetical protein